MNWNTRNQMALSPFFLILVSCASDIPIFSVEAEIQEVCIVGLSSEFEPSVEGIDGIVSRVFGGQELGIRLDERFSAEFYLSGVGMVADGSEEGVSNFEFIDSLNVSVSGGSAESKELLRYEGGAVATGSEWFVQTDSAVDLAQYLESEDLQIRFEFAGDLPNTMWTANMEICLSAHAGFIEKLPL